MQAYEWGRGEGVVLSPIGSCQQLSEDGIQSRGQKRPGPASCRLSDTG